jgi:hypothetical protein
MRRSRKMLLSWSDRLSMYAASFTDPGTIVYRLERARECIEDLKNKYRHKHLSFDYQHETICGEFVTAAEADIPGTYVVVLKLASSRICSGPCLLRVAGTRKGGIVETGEDGIVGIVTMADNWN